MSDKREGSDEASGSAELVEGVLTEAGGGLSGAIVGLAVAGPAGALVGAALTPVATAGIRLVTDGLRRRAVRVERALGLAAERAGVDVETFVENLRRDDARLELALRASRAAAETTVEEKVRALAVALAEASSTGERTRVDEIRLLVDAIADVETPHILLLTVLEKTPPQRSSSQLQGWAAGDISEHEPALDHVLEPLTQRLEHHGLVARAFRTGPPMGVEVDENEDWGPPVTMRITELGRDCLGLLRAMKDDD